MKLDRKIGASRAQEARGAALHGGTVQPGSGSGVKRKGDVITPEMLLEYKRTDGKSIRIELQAVELHRRRSLALGRVPVFAFELGGRDYVISEASDFHERTGCRCVAGLVGPR